MARPDPDPVLRRFFRLKLGAVGLLSAAGTVAVVASITGLAGRYWWAFDLASHFRVQYLVTLTISATALFALRSHRLAIVFAVVAGLNLVFVAPLYFGSRVAPDGWALRAMLINVYTANSDHEAVLATIRAHDPDFVLVEEVNHRWVEALRQLVGPYRYVAVEPREDNFGIALLSKHPVVNVRLLSVGGVSVPSILAEFELEGHRFFVLGTHALPPGSASYAERRDRQLAALPAITKGLDAPVLLLGDLNASPWSHHFRKLIRDSGLRNASKGRGPQPTWPTHMFPMRIPIDHCLHSPGIEIVDKMIGPRVGSDHYPVIVDFAVLPVQGQR